MILLIDTSSATCKFSFVDNNERHDCEWQGDKNLAKYLLKKLSEEMQKLGKQWSDISAIGVMRGPGSFTGLRIGITVMNTLADSQRIPIVGSIGSDWRNKAILQIQSGADEKIVLPFYEQEPHITLSRK